MPNTFVDELEEVVDEVATRVATDIQSIVDTLAPDGRPFGQELKSTEEQLIDYRGIRNDVEAWKLWISNRALKISQELKLGGVSEDKVAAINPLKLAVAFMIDYSTRMEKLIADRMI